jgi:hypothetical protein
MAYILVESGAASCCVGERGLNLAFLVHRSLLQRSVPPFWRR